MKYNLVREYLSYKNSQEADAVQFTRKYLRAAKGHWLDIRYCSQFSYISKEPEFKKVRVFLYKKKMRPIYPPKEDYTKNGIFDEHEYNTIVNAITWETAHKDIDAQKSHGIKGVGFILQGISYDKNNTHKHYFRSDAPPEIKALEENINDKTSPLWDYANMYKLKPEYVFKLKSVKKIQ